MQTITCLINDNYVDTCNPLIYTVTVPDLQYDTIMAAVEKERHGDVGNDEELELELLVAFKGDCEIAADWRG